MPRSPSPSRSRSRTRSPIKRRRSVTPDEITPFLIRAFVTKGKHTPLIDFDDGKFPYREEFHVYGSYALWHTGWTQLTIRKSSTPTSLIALLYPTFPAPYRSPIARFAFRHVYVDASQRGLYRSKDLVSFTGKELMSTISKDDDRGRKVDEKTLDEYGFITGDYISVSLHIPEPKVQNPLAQRSAPLGGREEKRNIEGDWARGEALPPAPRGGGRGGYAAGNGGRVMGMGIRGGARRSPSVTRDGGGGRRSRSPERRGGRRDRSP